MGYPMTFQRVLNRNRLQDGSYGAVPADWRGQDVEGRLRMLAGDLRRLEADAVDEKAICKYISWRLQLPDDTVAAVLKEFIAW